MPTFSIQYLEDSPAVAQIAPHAAAARLRAAFDRLPLALVLIGWRLPDATLDACAEVCTQRGAALYRWHPLLTGDGVFQPRAEWQVIGLAGEATPGFRNMPEFTFVCPNRPDAAQAALANLDHSLADNRYGGVFLDRIRWPSPTADPARWLGCFCPACQAAAGGEGLDLAETRRALLDLLNSPGGAAQLVRQLLAPDASTAAPLAALWAFRMRSVTRFVARAVEIARARGCAVGLDGFSPALTRLVGQELGALDAGADWTKIMCYGHALGPAGVPFELAALADWLIARGMADGGALALLAEAAGLPLPPTVAELRRAGLPPEALAREVHRGREQGIHTLLAGVELVDLAGVTALREDQIRADLAALRGARADGLALSWDLWHIPLERLDLVREVWEA